MRYTDVAWDFDGTLVDSYSQIVRIFKENLRCFGVVAEGEDIRRNLSVSIGYAHSYYAGEYGLDLEELGKQFRERREAEGLCLDEMNVYPGVAETLHAIKESGRRNHLYTNRDRSALRYLEEFSLLPYFDGIVTVENIGKNKPAPDGMYVLIKQFGIVPEKLLMVGDRAVDIDAAKAAGADACFYNTNGIEIPKGTDIVIENVKELLNYL